MNKTEVCQRPGWTAGRVEKFLEIEFERHLRGMYGRYVEYEYSLPQVVRAEGLATWRRAAEKYLKLPIDSLTDEKIAALHAEIHLKKELEERQEKERLAAEEAFRNSPEEVAKRLAMAEERRRRKEEEKKKEDEIAARLKGGLRRVGFAHPTSDGWRQFEEAQILPYVELAERAGLNADLVKNFYALWQAGAGYCNPLGNVRKIIAPIKARIMAEVLSLAKANSWTFGQKTGVLYIDTAEGQVSFHLIKGQNGYPKYEGDWTGKKNSCEIIVALLAKSDQNQNLKEMLAGAGGAA